MALARCRFLLFTALAMSAATSSARGQSMLDRMKQKAQEKAQAKADQAADSLTEAALNNSERAVKCVISNTACIQKAEEAGQPVTVVNAKGQPVSTPDSAKAIARAGAASGAPAAGPSTQASTPAGPGTEAADVAVNHDFTPGTRVIWTTDFARDPIGDFPRRLKLVDGNFETAGFRGSISCAPPIAAKSSCHCRKSFHDSSRLSSTIQAAAPTTRRSGSPKRITLGA